MEKGELDFSRQIVGISNVEKDELIIAKVIPNSFRPWGNYRFRKRKIFEDTRWRVDFSEDVAVVRDYPEVTILDRLHDLLEISPAEIIDNALESPFLGGFHNLFEEVCPFTTNTQSCGRNYLPHPLQRFYR